MKIRGGKSANILILLDGVPLKDVTGNDYTVSDLRLMALENIESIEILNGASSVLYGSNATVSVINIKTKKSAQKAVEGLLSARGGSFSTFAQNANLRGKIDQFNYQISGFNEKSEGISSAEGPDTFDKDGWEKQNISANIGFSDKNFEINLNSGWNHNLYLYDAGAFTDGNYRGNDVQFFVGGNADYQYKNGKITFNSRYSDIKRELQTLENSGYETDLNYKGKSFFNEIYNYYKFSENAGFILGLSRETQNLGSDLLPWNFEEVKLKDDQISNFDVYTNFNLRYQNFHLDLGGRWTENSKYGNHLVYSVNPYYLRDLGEIFYKIGYSYATAFIAPTLYQTFGFSSAGTLPNFDLKPETNASHEIDLSFGKKDQTLIFDASLFQRNENQTIIWVDNGDFTNQYENIGKNTVKGFEIGFHYKPLKIINFGGNFSFAESDNTETMLRQPKQRINSFVEILPLKSTKIVLSHLYVSKRTDRYSFPSIDVIDGSYHIFNVNINQKIFQNFDAYLNIGNLFNTPYVDVIGYSSKPRNYTLGFGYRF
jgi:vitamin B12 transporter